MHYDFHDKSIGIGFTGSFCTYEKIFEALETLKETGASLLPVFSLNASSLDSRFGTRIPIFFRFIPRASLVDKEITSGRLLRRWDFAAISTGVSEMPFASAAF